MEGLLLTGPTPSSFQAMTCQLCGSVFKTKCVKINHLKREHELFSPFLSKDNRYFGPRLVILLSLPWVGPDTEHWSQDLECFSFLFLFFPFIITMILYHWKIFFLFLLFFCWITFYGELQGLKNDFVSVLLQQATCGSSTWGCRRSRRWAGHSPARGTGRPAWEEGKTCKPAYTVWPQNLMALQFFTNSVIWAELV